MDVEIVRDLGKLKQDFNLTSQDLADKWETAKSVVQEWEHGLVDPRYAGVVSEAILRLRENNSRSGSELT